jgi:hypothetical protein
MGSLPKRVTSAWMEIPSDGEAAEVPDQHNIHDLFADAIVVLQIDGCTRKIFGDAQDLNSVDQVFI